MVSFSRVIDAVGFAAEAHRHQRRKDAEASPYINHPIALLRILAVEGSVQDEDALCAAALHDYLGDCCGVPNSQRNNASGATPYKVNVSTAAVRFASVAAMSKVT